MVPALVFSEDFRDGSALDGVRFRESLSPGFMLRKWFQSFLGFMGKLGENSWEGMPGKLEGKK